MASTATATATATAVLLFSIIIALSTTTTTARPCKTIFFITSTTTTTDNNQQILQKPNFHLLRNPNPNSPRLTFFVTEIRQFHRTRSLPRPFFFDRTIESSSSSLSSSSSSSSSNDVVSSEPYFSSSSSVKTSIRERTMDIMSIVGALLFGVGCGALTAATMYLIWSLFAPRRFDFGADSDEESDYYEENDDNNNNNNNNGYVAVPAAANKPVPPTADEVAAMK